MSTRRKTKLVHEGEYVAEVEVDVMDSDAGWAPYLWLEDAYRLDDVRSALRRGDIKAASRLARVYSLSLQLPNSSVVSSHRRAVRRFENPLCISRQSEHDETTCFQPLPPLTASCRILSIIADS